MLVGPDLLGELVTAGSPEDAELSRTLRVLINPNMIVAEAARLPYFHYSTLRYRFRKLKRALHYQPQLGTDQCHGL